MKEPKFIVVVGASAGGLSALIEFVSQLKIDMDAAFFIVMHLSKKGISNFLVNQLNPLTQLACNTAVDGTPIERGHIYVAPANKHLLVSNGKVIVGHGPEENWWRPSIDILFRSAAAAYSTRVIGIVLTGLLNDGTAGMLAIKKSGGVTIVQDPNEAEYPDMALSVLQAMEVNYCIELVDMGEILSKLMLINPPESEAPIDVIAEAKIAERMTVNIEAVKDLSEEHSVYSCPDCGGGLWKISDDNITRYRCHIGHAYLENDLLNKQDESVEKTIWVALRMLEERNNLLTKISNDHRKKGLVRIANQYLQSAKELQTHIITLKDLLVTLQGNNRNIADDSNSAA